MQAKVVIVKSLGSNTRRQVGRGRFTYGTSTKLNQKLFLACPSYKFENNLAAFARLYPLLVENENNQISLMQLAVLEIN